MSGFSFDASVNLFTPTITLSPPSISFFRRYAFCLISDWKNPRSIPTSEPPILSIFLRYLFASASTEDGPALSGVADHCSERIGERSGDQGFSQDQNEIGQRRRVFIGVGGIGIKKSATVGPEVFDGHL